MPDERLGSLVKDEINGMTPNQLEKFRSELKRTIPQVIKNAGEKARQDDKQTATKAGGR